ncbi:hypothetical protein Tco_1281797 [Tanacetum coccineum]
MVKTGLFKAIDSLIPLDEHLATFLGNGYTIKLQKRAREWKEREKSIEKPKIKDEAETEETLNGPTRTHLIGRDAAYHKEKMLLCKQEEAGVQLNNPQNSIETFHSTHQTPTQVPTVTAPENIIQAETNTENAQFDDDEFINIFSTPVQEQGETSTRRQLETDGEMCMFALTVSRTEPKNIKEAMANSAWIESMQEELHQFDRLDVWELVDRPLCKNVINLKEWH